VHPNGVGQKKASDLEAWRRVVESRAVASQPSALPTAETQAIRGKYAHERQTLMDQEKSFRTQAAMSRTQIEQKWAPTHQSMSSELVATRQAFGQERAEADLRLNATQKQASVAAWQRDLAERELAAFRHVSYRRYLLSAFRAG
jgi:hypothetical protein